MAVVVELFAGDMGHLVLLTTAQDGLVIEVHHLREVFATSSYLSDVVEVVISLKGCGSTSTILDHI